MSYMKSAGVKSPILISMVVLLRLMLLLWVMRVVFWHRPMPVHVRPDVERLRIERPLTNAPNLLIHYVIRPRDIEGRANANATPVKMGRPWLRHMTTAINLFILMPMLIVEIRFQSQLGAAHETLEATAMEKCKILERPYPIHLVHRLCASETGALVKVHAIHGDVCVHKALYTTGNTTLSTTAPLLGQASHAFAGPKGTSHSDEVTGVPRSWSAKISHNL